MLILNGVREVTAVLLRTDHIHSYAPYLHYTHTGGGGLTSHTHGRVRGGEGVMEGGQGYPRDPKPSREGGMGSLTSLTHTHMGGGGKD